MNDKEKADLENGYTPSKRPKCDRCGNSRLMWLMVKGGWRLCSIDDAEPHVCTGVSPGDLGSVVTETQV